MKQYDVPHQTCVGCGESMDATTPITGPGKPTKGDVTVCLYCGTVQEFDADLRLVQLTGAKLDEVVRDPIIVRLRAAISDLHTRH